MAETDNRDSGPVSIDEYLDSLGPEPGQAEEVTDAPPQEAQADEVEAEEVETDEVEAEDAETDEQDEPEAEDEAPEAYPVDEYGEIVVTLKDGTRTTLKDLADGNLRQADYSRKTAELSQARKEIEAAQKALAERERQLNEQFASLEEPEPDWRKLAEEDPLGWQLQKVEWDKKQAERSQRRQQAEQARQQEIMNFRRQTAALAVERMPEWADQGAFQASAEARKRAALEAGFTEQEYAQAIDFRLAVLLEKAARYDAGQTKVKATQKKLAKVPKVVKPGASNSTKSERQAAERTAMAKRRNKPMSVDEYLATFDIE